MSVDVSIPSLGESITEGTIVAWLVEVGEHVDEDQPLLELETDKVTAELPAPAAGVITEQLFEAGADVEVGAVVARIDPTAEAGVTQAVAAPAQPDPTIPTITPPEESVEEPVPTPTGRPLSPAVRRLVDENDLDPSVIEGTGKDGRLLKGDVLAYLESHPATPPVGPPAPTPEPRPAPAPRPTGARAAIGAPTGAGGRAQRRVRMTRIRRATARRLKDVQNTAAILTTFNEVDMKPVMDLRARYKEAFIARHGVKLGFMSFFVKSAIEALKEYPALNGMIDGDELVFHDYYDIGVAVSSERGLVVPVLRDADRLSLAEIEQTMGDLARAARDGSLGLEQLSGGTFSITNGGVFGSMLSTPILNPPQSGILGMHNIVRRPVAIGDDVVIRPIMFVALSYDHRIVDGSQAVRFLVKIKQLLEDPARMLLEV